MTIRLDQKGIDILTTNYLLKLNFKRLTDQCMRATVLIKYLVKESKMDSKTLFLMTKSILLGMIDLREIVVKGH